MHAGKVWGGEGGGDHRLLASQAAPSLLYVAPEVVQGLPCCEKVRSTHLSLHRYSCEQYSVSLAHSFDWHNRCDFLSLHPKRE